MANPSKGGDAKLKGLIRVTPGMTAWLPKQKFRKETANPSKDGDAKLRSKR
jgi:hypothetical protein